MTDLSPAEQAVAAVLVDGDWSQVADVVVRGGVAATARELVAAARPLILIEVFRAQAERFKGFAEGAASRADWEFAAELMESLAKSVEEGSRHV